MISVKHHAVPDSPVLTSTEEAVYVALQAGTDSSRPTLSLPEVVNATGLGQEEVQEACRRLLTLD